MNIAILPLRKGSKGIPGKNRKYILGRPLFSWCLYEAIKSELDKVYVFTNDENIINFVKSQYSSFQKVHLVERSSKNAEDKSSTEDAIAEFVRLINDEFDTLTLLQATSPLISHKDINKCLKKVRNNDFDSSMTVTSFKRFLWNYDGTPLNYDPMDRPRRQDFDGLFAENGACYTTSRSAYFSSLNRISGKIALVEMSQDSFIEIDEPNDFDLVESLLESRIKNIGDIRQVKLLCLDVDGVLTDGTVNFNLRNEHTKNFSLVDGKGLELIRRSGIDVMVITSEDSDIVRARLTKLNIRHSYLGIKDKYAVLDRFLQENQLAWDEVAYVGDDVNDITNIIAAGVSFAPLNASLLVKLKSNYLVSKSGGNGAVREVCEVLLKNRVNWK